MITFVVNIIYLFLNLKLFQIALKYKTICDIKSHLYNILARYELKQENKSLVFNEKTNKNSFNEISSKKIIEIVAKHHKISTKDILSKSQKKKCRHCQTGSYLFVQGFTWLFIGKTFKNL